jgi:histidinol dehydrogenase
LDVVKPIVQAVEKDGDAAVRAYTEKFDGVALPEDGVVVKVSDLPEPELDADVKMAFDVAFENIKAFHAAQVGKGDVDVSTMPGVRCRRVSRPIGAVGLYVPGGTAVLPSTALMLAVPAMIAGCETIVLATPPRKDGTIVPEVLYVAKKAGVTHVLKAGGAQAIAAMGFGTQTCPKVDKLFGPGNQFVTAAKMFLQNSDAMVSIDMPAGPSEVLVIADKDAPPAHVAADLLSQAEHGPDSQVVLVTMPDVDLKAITDDMAAACNFSNRYAPEHLIVNVENAESYLPQLDNAGSIFLGRWTPESVGDYASGTNHVLPTYGYSRMYSGVSLDSFSKYMTVQELTKEGLEKLGPHVARMASVEGLDAHRSAVTLRLGMD